MDAAWKVPGSPPGALAWQRPFPHSTTAVGGRHDLQPPGMVSLLIISAGRPSLQCHHQLFLDVLDLSGRGRHMRLFSPFPRSGGVSVPGAVGGCCPPPSPASPAPPFPKGGSCWGGHPGVDARAALPHVLAPRSAVAR